MSCRKYSIDRTIFLNHILEIFPTLKEADDNVVFIFIMQCMDSNLAKHLSMFITKIQEIRGPLWSHQAVIYLTKPSLQTCNCNIFPCKTEFLRLRSNNQRRCEIQMLQPLYIDNLECLLKCILTQVTYLSLCQVITHISHMYSINHYVHYLCSWTLPLINRSTIYAHEQCHHFTLVKYVNSTRC